MSEMNAIATSFTIWPTSCFSVSLKRANIDGLTAVA